MQPRKRWSICFLLLTIMVFRCICSKILFHCRHKFRQNTVYKINFKNQFVHSLFFWDYVNHLIVHKHHISSKTPISVSQSPFWSYIMYNKLAHFYHIYVIPECFSCYMDWTPLPGGAFSYVVVPSIFLWDLHKQKVVMERNELNADYFT